MQRKVLFHVDTIHHVLNHSSTANEIAFTKHPRLVSKFADNHFRVQTTGVHSNVIDFHVDWVRVPFSQYIIDAFNDRFTLDVSSTEYTVQITHGDYTGSELATALDTALTDAYSASWTVTYDSNTRKFTITSSVSYTLKFRSTPLTDTAHWLLGFNFADAASSGGSNTTTSDNPILLERVPYVQIESTMGRGESTSGSLQLMCVVYQDPSTNSFSQVVHNTTELDEPQTFRGFEFRVLNPDGTAYALHNQPMQISVTLTILEDHEDELIAE